MSKDNTTKESILSNAKQLFGQYGFASTSTQMIAEAVGIKKPSLYYFFKNKEAIYIHLLEKAIAEVQELFEGEQYSKLSFEERLVILFKFSKDNGSFIFSVHTLTPKNLKHVMEISESMASVMLKYLNSSSTPSK